MASSNSRVFESPKAFEKTPADVVKRWTVELDRGSDHEQTWRETRAEAAEERYRDESERSGSKFNIFWSNVQILKPALFSGSPKPDVRRRFNDKDEQARKAAEVIERALEATVDAHPFAEAVEDAVEDSLIAGRGVLRVRYNPIFGRDDPERIPLTVEAEEGPFGEQVGESFSDPDGGQVESDDVKQDEDGPHIMRSGDEEVVDETVTLEYVPWDDFRISPAKRWQDVRWVAFRTYLTRDELVDQFGDEIGKEVALTEEGATPSVPSSGAAKGSPALSDPIGRAEVWEIWDKVEREMIVISPGLTDKPLQSVPDPLGLKNFFPTPKPLYAVKGNRTLIPIPEFTLYQDLANELDEITARIRLLVRAMKVVGVYADFMEVDLGRMLKSNENELVPAKNWDTLAERGGLKGVIDILDLQEIAAALQVAYTQRATLIQAIFEITGISDIVRGATDPNETLGAQKLKSQFGALRIRPRQQGVQRMIREVFVMMAEIMAEHFSADTLKRMTGDQFDEDTDFDAVLELLRDEGERGFRIDIETDSTVVADEEAEKKASIELAGGLGSFINQTAVALATGVLTKEMFNELILAFIRPFKMSRKIEQIIEDGQKEQTVEPGQPTPGQTEQPQGETLEEGRRADAETEIKSAEMEGNQQVKVAELELKKAELDIKREALELDKLREENRHSEAVAKENREALTGAAA